MNETSPSNKKVDDFLSSLSQLSQDRLREDQRRQRSLQRNIDELRRSSSNNSSPLRSSSSHAHSSSSYIHDDIPQLTFNRDSKYTDSKFTNSKSMLSRRDQFYHDLKSLDDEPTPPPKPKRPALSFGDDEHAPSLPTRPGSRTATQSSPSPPALPRRRDADIGVDADINLMRPVARSSSSYSIKKKPPPKPAPKSDHLRNSGDSDTSFDTIDHSEPKSSAYKPKSSAYNPNSSANKPTSSANKPTSSANKSYRQRNPLDLNIATDIPARSPPSTNTRLNTHSPAEQHTPASSIGTVNTITDPKTGAKRILFIDARDQNPDGYASYDREYDLKTPNTSLPQGSALSARGSTPTIAVFDANSAKGDAPKTTYKSFADMESNIKSGKQLDGDSRKLFNQYSTPPATSAKRDQERFSSPSGTSPKPFKPIKPAKSDWLTSTLHNTTTSDDGMYVPRPSYYNAISASQAAKVVKSPSHTDLYSPAKTSFGDDSQNSSFPRSPSIRVGQTPRSWIDSVVSRADQLDTYEDPNKRNFSITRRTDNSLQHHDEEISYSRNGSPSKEKNPHSWLDSVARTVGDTDIDEFGKPSYVIPKKDTTSLDLYKPEEEEKEPDYLSLLAKFKSEGKKSPTPPKTKERTLSPEEEELLRLRKEKISGKSLKSPPPKPAKSKAAISEYEKNEEDLLRQQLGRLSPTKSPGFDRHLKKDYESADQELLKTQLNKLSLHAKKQSPSVPPKASIHNYEEKDAEILRSHLKKLGGSKLPKTPTGGDGKPKQDEGPEGLKALTKLKPAKVPPPKKPELPEALRRLEALKSGKRSASPSKASQLEECDEIDTSNPPEVEKLKEKSEPSQSVELEKFKSSELEKSSSAEVGKSKKSGLKESKSSELETSKSSKGGKDQLGMAYVDEEKDKSKKAAPPKPLKKVLTDVKPTQQSPQPKPNGQQAKLKPKEKPEQAVKAKEQDAKEKEQTAKKEEAAKKEQDVKEKEQDKSGLSKTPFHNKLASILKASTAPALGPSPGVGASPIARSNTDVSVAVSKRMDTPGTGKLTHPNKSRSKGPKRKLPKSMQQKQPQQQSTALKKDIKPLQSAKVQSGQVPDYKKKKMAPPINKSSKPRPTEVKPSRVLSGEVFI